MRYAKIDQQYIPVYSPIFHMSRTKQCNTKHSVQKNSFIVNNQTESKVCDTFMSVAPLEYLSRAFFFSRAITNVGKIM